ncbi:hypothetical protein L2E82_45396 [Cichorium intybus]|uniref:Uncharacterized protein n=1 Tax=Cichorium intybus TaxID=13427 RepID=A0ACB8ZU75_CICIN|nr:hypothetical protein L2E82_45396 [Cichorium intybus]
MVAMGRIRLFSKLDGVKDGNFTFQYLRKATVTAMEKGRHGRKTTANEEEETPAKAWEEDDGQGGGRNSGEGGFHLGFSETENGSM